METVSVEAVATEIKRKFHMELPLRTVISNCADVLKKMGMAALERTTEVFRVSNYCITMDQNVYKIDSVVQLDPYQYPTDVELQDIIFPPQSVPNNPSIVKKEEDLALQNDVYNGMKPNVLSQIKGVYTDFKWDCPYIKLNYTDYDVAVTYVSISKDAEGLPIIPAEALNACVYYNVYCEMEPALIAGKIPDYTFARVEEWKNKHINQSKTMLFFKNMNKNEMDKLFDIMASMDRKSVNIDS